MCGRFHFRCLRRRAAASFTRIFARRGRRLEHAFARRNGSIVALIFAVASHRDPACPALGPVAVAVRFDAGTASVAVVRVVIRVLPVAFRSFAGAARAWRCARSSVARVRRRRAFAKIRRDCGIRPVLRVLKHVSENDVFLIWTSRRPMEKQAMAGATLSAGGWRGGGDSGGRKHMAKIN